MTLAAAGIFGTPCCEAIFTVSNESFCRWPKRKKERMENKNSSPFSSSFSQTVRTNINLLFSSFSPSSFCLPAVVHTLKQRWMQMLVCLDGNFTLFVFLFFSGSFFPLLLYHLRSLLPQYPLLSTHLEPCLYPLMMPIIWQLWAGPLIRTTYNCSQSLPHQRQSSPASPARNKPRLGGPPFTYYTWVLTLGELAASIQADRTAELAETYYWGAKVFLLFMQPRARPTRLIQQQHPTGRFTTSELENQSQDVPESHKISRSSDFRAKHFWNGRSGSRGILQPLCPILLLRSELGSNHSSFFPDIPCLPSIYSSGVVFPLFSLPFQPLIPNYSVARLLAQSVTILLAALLD